MAPFFCKVSNGVHEKLPEEVSKVASPLTDFNFGRSNSVKLPVTTSAPPTVATFLKPSMIFNWVLLATTKPPPIVVKLEQSKEVNSSLELTEKV